jgi:N-acetylmuramoyl-L-alanine amidase
MIFISAGHVADKLSPRYDPGACDNGHTEAELAKTLRDLTYDAIVRKGGQAREESDAINLAETILQIRSTPGDIICDIHFNAATPAATGVEVFTPDRATDYEKDLAGRIAARFANCMGIRNRGVKPESFSQHKKLGIMKPAGTNILIEVAFITNTGDLNAFLAKKSELAEILAEELIMADKVIEA